MSEADRRKEKEDRDSLNAMRQLSPLLGAGAQMAAAVVMMFFAGRWLDEKWGTTPWMVLTGILFGSVAGFYQFFKAVSEAGKSEQKETDTKQ